MKKEKNCFQLCNETMDIEKQTLSLTHKKDKGRKHEGCIDFIFCVAPSGKVGYRIELDGEDIGTIFWSDKERRFVLLQW